MALVVGPRLVIQPVTLAYAASLTPDAAAGSYRVCTLTGDATLNPPTNPVDGQQWQARFIASAAQRTLTLAGGLRRPSHIAVTLVIASGRRGDVALLYEAADSAWSVRAAQAYA